MPLSYAQKEQEVSEIEKIGQNAVSSIIVDYSGLTSVAMTDLRKQAREKDIVIKVLRNRLAKRALKDTNLACLDEKLQGPVLIATSSEDPGAPARLMKSFMKEHKTIEVKALTINDQLLEADQLKAVTSLPTYEVAISMLMSTMLAPITQLVRTINEPVVQVARAVSAVGQKKQ